MIPLSLPLKAVPYPMVPLLLQNPEATSQLKHWVLETKLGSLRKNNCFPEDSPSHDSSSVLLQHLVWSEGVAVKPDGHGLMPKSGITKLPMVVRPVGPPFIFEGLLPYKICFYAQDSPL